MEQNKLCVAQRTCDTVCFGMEIYVCLSQRKKSPSATAPGSPSPYFMLCQLQNGVISDRGKVGAKPHENMTSRSQREEVWIRYTSLTQETSIRSRLDEIWLRPSCKQTRATGIRTRSSHRQVSIPFIYHNYFWDEFFWPGTVNMVVIQHGKWPQTHLSNDTQSTTDVLTRI